jgi:hypothetical protein
MKRKCEAQETPQLVSFEALSLQDTIMFAARVLVHCGLWCESDNAAVASRCTSASILQCTSVVRLLPPCRRGAAAGSAQAE